MKERVYTVDIFWDFPISGIADFQGKPYFFDLKEDSDEESDSIYNLIPIEKEIYDLLIEKFELWKAFQDYIQKGEHTEDSGPVLEKDRERFDFLKNKIDSYLFLHQSQSFKTKASFKIIEEKQPINFSEFEVDWIKY
jgi:hypothetical protein